MATTVSEEKELIRSLQRQADPNFIRSHSPAENARALADELWFLGVIDEGEVAAVAAELEREYEEYFWPFEESEVSIEEESVGHLISNKTPFEEQFVSISTANGTVTAVVDPPVVLGLPAGSLSRKRQKKSELAEKRQLGAALTHLGVRHLELGLVSRAIEYLEQALQLRRAIGDRQGEGNQLGNLGCCYQGLGDARRAIDYHEQALVISREIGDRRGEGSHLGNLGTAFATQKRFDRALACWLRSTDIFRRIQSPDAEKAEQNIANLRQQLGKEAFAPLEAEARPRLDEIIEEILAKARQAAPPQE